VCLRKSVRKRDPTGNSHRLNAVATLADRMIAMNRELALRATEMPTRATKVREMANSAISRVVELRPLPACSHALAPTAHSEGIASRHAGIRYSRMTELMMPHNPTLAMPNLPKLTLPKREDGAQPVCLDIAVSDQISTSIPISMTCVAGMLK